MEVDEVRETLEDELRWREEELAFFNNILNDISDKKKDQYRKSLILLLYAHFEGFVKVALLTYLQYLNKKKLIISSVCIELMASGLERQFKAYDNLDVKSKIFKRKLPDHTKLHRLCRRIHFLEEMDDFKSNKLVLTDDIINTESNLWYIVLQKNLLKLGFSIDLFAKYQPDIDRLVNRRNSIAHGNSRLGVTLNEYENWKNIVYDIETHLIRTIYDYLLHEKYLVNKQDISIT